MTKVDIIQVLNLSKEWEFHRYITTSYFGQTLKFGHYESHFVDPYDCYAHPLHFQSPGRVC